MRDWAKRSDELEAANTRLLIVTPDAGSVLDEVVPKRQLTGTFALGGVEQWAAWGIKNPKRPELPFPSTFVIAADGTVLRADVHENFRKRSDTEEVAEELGVDWAAGATIAYQPGPPGALLLTIAAGFHAYGSGETTARPVAVRVQGHPDVKVAVPKGDKRDLSGLGESWVLEGTVSLPIPEGAGGELDLQLCTDTSCSVPQTLPWGTAR